MAAFDTTRPVAALNTGRFSNAFAQMMGALATWNDARVTRKALSKLTARELEDIGLTYADLDKIHSITR